MADAIDKGEALIASIRQFMGPDTATEKHVKQALAEGVPPEEIAAEMAQMLRDTPSG